MTLIGAGLSSEVFLEAPDRVLKLYRAPSEPAAIANEFQATALAQGFGLPVARPISIVQQDGRTGILFDRLDGAIMTRHYARNPVGLLIALRRLALIQHAVHACAGEGLPSQHERLRAEIGWARVPEAMRAAALDALDALPTGTRLCHGDIHPANVICTRTGLRLIDWQKASAGNPAGDVARTELMIRHGRVGSGVGRLPAAQAIRGLAASWYVHCYRAASGMRADAIAAWRLPLTVARLCGRRTDKDGEILGVIEGLMAGGKMRRPARAG